MKYIKNFNLIVESVKDDLKEFCEMNLAYLMDDDYKVMITPLDFLKYFLTVRRDSLPSFSPGHKQGHLIHFYRWIGGKTDFFELSEVEDHFIPFLQRLSNQYEVIECVVDYFTVAKSTTRLSVEQVVNGGIELNTLISRILIIVAEE
jgi:hypothetical protein